MKNKIFAAFLAVAALLSQHAYAGLIVNGSFEHKDIGQLVTDSDLSEYHIKSGKRWGVFSSFYGWEFDYGPGLELQQSGLLKNWLTSHNAAHGSIYAELDSHSSIGAPTNAGIYQRLGNLVVGATYELSFWYQPRSDVKDSSILNVYWFNTVSANQPNLLGMDPNFIVNEVKSDKSSWQQYTVRFITDTDSMTIGFGAGGLGDTKGALFDDVSLRQVPAPTSLAIVGLGLLTLVLRRKLSR